MIVTQYGRPVPLPVHSGELDDRGSHVSSALDQLRGYYGLGSASPSGPGPDYFRGVPCSRSAVTFAKPAWQGILFVTGSAGPAKWSGHRVAVGAASHRCC